MSVKMVLFDLDGTLFCETDPNYFDYTLLAYRVLEDPDYKDRASDFEREVAANIVDLNETGVAMISVSRRGKSNPSPISFPVATNTNVSCLLSKSMVCQSITHSFPSFTIRLPV